MTKKQPLNEQGTSAAELLIMMVVIVGLVMVVVAAGRYVDGQAQANDAAYAAARAASLHTSPGTGLPAGRRAAIDSLAERGKACDELQVSLEGSDFTPGGQVIAEVRCTVSLADTGSVGQQLGLRPTTTFTERAAVPIEQYRVER